MNQEPTSRVIEMVPTNMLMVCKETDEKKGLEKKEMKLFMLLFIVKNTDDNYLL